MLGVALLATKLVGRHRRDHRATQWAKKGLGWPSADKGTSGGASTGGRWRPFGHGPLSPVWCGV